MVTDTSLIPTEKEWQEFKNLLRTAEPANVALCMEIWRGWGKRVGLTSIYELSGWITGILDKEDKGEISLDTPLKTRLLEMGRVSHAFHFEVVKGEAAAKQCHFCTIKDDCVYSEYSDYEREFEVSWYAIAVDPLRNFEFIRPQRSPMDEFRGLTQLVRVTINDCGHFEEED
jgi:hypothetical protein